MSHALKGASVQGRHAVVHAPASYPTQYQHAGSRPWPSRSRGHTISRAAAAESDIGVLSERELQVKLAIASSMGKLDLSDCRLPLLPEGLFELSDLEELSLSGACSDLQHALSVASAFAGGGCMWFNTWPFDCSKIGGIGADMFIQLV